MFIGTIHGYCLNLLQEHISEYKKYSILDEIQTKLFVDKNYSKIGMKHLSLERYIDTDLFLGIIDIIRESELEKDKLPDKYKYALREYQDVFDNEKVLDFTMIMLKAIEHLEEDEVLRKKLKEQIKFLTVDEYQDINPIQERIVKVFADLGVNLCVVGDDDQTIYRWRGSEINNILEFSKKYISVNEVILAENFRSSNAIIDLATKIANNNKNRKLKEMIYSSDVVYEEGDITYNEFDAPEDEGAYIAERINDLIKSGLSYSDIVILTRIKRITIEINILQYLTQAKIPFIVEGINELFQVRETIAARSIFDYLNKSIDKDVLKANWMRINYTIDADSVNRAIEYLDDWFPEKHYFYGEYILQKIFHGFFALLNIHEPESSAEKLVPKELELIFYNLGKFSQVIDDFEKIYYKTSPDKKLQTFCKFLYYSAESYYPEGHLQNDYIKPDAVRIMTIHQSKGLQFPVVFIPGLSKNIFPLKKKGGKQAVHVLKEDKVDDLITNFEKYLSGDIEDERRLFYVGVTRAQKFLFLTRAVYNERMNRQASKLLNEAKSSHYLIKNSNSFIYTNGRQLIKKEGEQKNIVLNFSVLSDFFYCPQRFKLTYFYGFAQPIATPMGYGTYLHNIVMDIHKGFIGGKNLDEGAVAQIVNTHFHLPYANEKLFENMKKRAVEASIMYLKQNLQDFKNIEFVEKGIEIDLGDGIRINGKIDLVKRKELDKVRTTIVDFKTREIENNDSISAEQLKIYALGYQALTGEQADYIEFYNLDENVQDRQKLDNDELEKTKERIITATESIRNDKIYKKCEKSKCSDCYIKNICLSNQQAKSMGIEIKKEKR